MPKPASRMWGRRSVCALCQIAVLAFPAAAEVKRVVIIKADGLPPRLLERYVGENAGRGREGRSRLPWIHRVFQENGTWFENFYVRGLSLSAPSWSLLDTGRHLEIRANAEYDRYTFRSHDYLNFFPFYVGYAMSRSVDMAGVQLMDEEGIPLLIDRFPYQQQFQGFQLFQRGVRWRTLEGSLKRSVRRSPKELFDEWQTGFSMANSVYDQAERELIEKLKDPQVRYLDFFTGEYDHVGHLTPDRVAQAHAVESIDALVGRVWTGILQSPLADGTVLVLISDHGMNTTENVYSQGYNLLDWFTSAAGGAHQVLTNRHPMTEFKLRGLDPFVSEVITPTRESAYLNGLSNYPTAMLELDGNEKASIGLRSNTFNILHILLDQLTRKKLPGSVRAAALNAFFMRLDEVRAAWQEDLNQLDEELAVLDARIAGQEPLKDTKPKKWSAEQRAEGLDKENRRTAHQLETWRAEAAEYRRYSSTMQRLLDLSPADFDPGKFKIEDLIPARSLGPLNSVYDLQNYVTGPAAGGLVTAPDGSLDFERSFRKLNYFTALGALSVRNQVQQDVDPKPVDFIAVTVPRAQLAALLPAEDQPGDDGIWLWGTEDRQALILRRHAPSGTSELRYIPIAHLEAGPEGSVRFQAAEPGPGFPLQLYEDPQLRVPAAWLNQWHSEHEWLEAIHQTRYSNGVIGLTEEMLSDPLPSGSSVLDRFRERQRNLRRTDLLVLARDHWNFNVRGFNPGGNHGSFLRMSTHSVLLVAGGKDTGIPRGLRVQSPYDGLSFVPTILALLGKPEPDLPGVVIEELVRDLNTSPN